MTSSIAIINWNSGRLLRICIESLLATTAAAEIVVIDNASGDDSATLVQGISDRVHCVRNRVNRGFAAAVNQAFETTSSPYVLILNPDVRALPGAVQLLEDVLNANPRAAAVGGYVGGKYLPRALPTVTNLVLENLGLRSGRVVIPARNRDGRRKPGAAPYQVEQPAAAALMIRRAAYIEVGGFDEQFFPAWYEDVDFCARIKAKAWEIYFAPAAEFLHEGGYSTEAIGLTSFLRTYYGNQLRYARKHFGVPGSAAVQGSIAAGMLGRMITRPKRAAAYGKALIEVLRGW